MSDHPNDGAAVPSSPEMGQFISASRKARVRAALEHRLGSVVTVVEAVHRRHNTSAILRSCEAFGVHEVHMVTGPFRPAKGAARGAERWLDLRLHAGIGLWMPSVRGASTSWWQTYRRAPPLMTCRSMARGRGLRKRTRGRLDDARAGPMVPSSCP